jgi:hypothetical protein
VLNLFLSWSGDHSRAVAVALRDWLPYVISNIELFMSSRDIGPGRRWQVEIAAQLKETDFGIVCVTADNQAAPWLNFEAGALAKAVDTSHVIPLAIDLKLTDIKPPLGQFQALPATKDGVWQIVKLLNDVVAAPRTETQLDRVLEKWWPDLQQELKAIAEQASAAAEAPVEPRDERDLLEEILSTVRGISGTRTPFVDDRASRDRDLPAVVAQMEDLIAQVNVDAKVLRSASSRSIGIFSEGMLPGHLLRALQARAKAHEVELLVLPHVAMQSESFAHD